MGRMTPVITCTMGTILIIWIVVGAVTFPNANRWFKGTSAKIVQDFIALPSNQSHAIQSRVVLDEFHCETDVFLNQNTPKDGLQGVLFDRDLSCSAQVPDAIPFRPTNETALMKKIALIKLGGCYFVQKILFAEKGGAAAAIVFNNISMAGDPDKSTILNIPSDMISIPVYFVNFDAGLELYSRLRNASQVDLPSSKLQVQPPNTIVRITLFPNRPASLDPWQFALIVIGAILLVSVAIIVGMQYYLWRKNRHRVFEDGTRVELSSSEDQFWRSIVGDAHPLACTQGQHRLAKEAVDALPTRVFNSKANMSLTALPSQEGQMSCVICLEAFSTGDILRCLPCAHEYHRDCIDTWLTKKNASCPLCQSKVELEAPNSAYVRPRSIASMPALAPII